MNISACYNTTCAVPFTGGIVSNLAFAVQYFTTLQCLAGEGTYPDSTLNDYKTYDFIIVGAGSTGCVLANRLSEIKQWNILLIEAGDDPPIEANIPGLTTSMWYTAVDWGYTTVNEGITNKGNIGESVYWPRGKMVGGSSNMNFMAYIEGNTQDYHRWVDVGNREWCLEHVRRCFKKSVNLQDMEMNKHPEIYEHYGHDEPFIVNTFNATYRPDSKNILKSFQEVGIKNVLDLNVANVLGSGIARATAYNGMRNSVSKAYLQPVKNRHNLHIKKRTKVIKILIKDNKAYGVKVLSRGKPYEIYANKDVIVSAGSINSPQLLMLSGVGPSSDLKSNKIKSVIDLPMVGQNLKDHAIIPITIYTNETNNIPEVDRHFDTIEYFYNRSGPLAHCEVYDILAFFSLDEKAKYPDFEIFLTKFTKNAYKLKDFLIKMFQYKDIVADSIVEINKNHTLYMFFISLLHPHSSGNISLSSNNTEDSVQIFPNYFKIQRDLELMVYGIDKFLNILNSVFFKSTGGFLGRIKWPECDKFELGSRNYWKCIGINLVGTDYHPMGTCKMGSDQNNSVVSSRLNVHGIDNLRVIDASIFPNTISGNINAPCVMVGERAAEIIKEDYKDN